MENHSKSPFGSVTAKVMMGGGIVVIVALLLVSFKVINFPPSDTEGAIGIANKYRAEQISDADVITKDPQIQALLQNDQFIKLTQDKRFQKMVQSKDFQGAFGYALPRTVDDENTQPLFGGGVSDALSFASNNAEFAGLLAERGFDFNKVAEFKSSLDEAVAYASAKGWLKEGVDDALAWSIWSFPESMDFAQSAEFKSLLAERGLDFAQMAEFKSALDDAVAYANTKGWLKEGLDGDLAWSIWNVPQALDFAQSAEFKGLMAEKGLDFAQVAEFKSVLDGAVAYANTKGWLKEGIDDALAWSIWSHPGAFDFAVPREYANPVKGTLDFARMAEFKSSLDDAIAFANTKGWLKGGIDDDLAWNIWSAPQAFDFSQNPEFKSRLVERSLDFAQVAEFKSSLDNAIAFADTKAWLKGDVDQALAWSIWSVPGAFDFAQSAEFKGLLAESGLDFAQVAEFKTSLDNAIAYANTKGWLKGGLDNDLAFSIWSYPQAMDFAQSAEFKGLMADNNLDFAQVAEFKSVLDNAVAYANTKAWLHDGVDNALAWSIWSVPGAFDFAQSAEFKSLLVESNLDFAQIAEFKTALDGAIAYANSEARIKEDPFRVAELAFTMPEAMSFAVNHADVITAAGDLIGYQPFIDAVNNLGFAKMMQIPEATDALAYGNIQALTDMD